MYKGSSSDDCDDDLIPIDLDYEEKETLKQLQDEVDLKEAEFAEESLFLEGNLTEGGFVLVRLVGKRSVGYYVAEIVKKLNASTFQVKYLKRLSDTNMFVREIEDVYDIEIDDVEMRLPLPMTVGGSQRQMLQLSFPVDLSTYDVK